MFTCPMPARGVCGSADKSPIVDWARDEASRVDGQVQVRDVTGKIEAVYTYAGGIERQEPGRMSPPAACSPSQPPQRTRRVRQRAARREPASATGSA